MPNRPVRLNAQFAVEGHMLVVTFLVTGGYLQITYASILAVYTNTRVHTGKELCTVGVEVNWIGC